MKDSIILGLVQNTAILLSFAMLYDYFWLKTEENKSFIAKLLTGFVLGGIGLVLMFTPWTLVPGIVFDTRSIMLSVSGLFFGPIPTIIAMAVVGTVRAFMGGGGVWMGLAVIISSGTIGIAWRRFRPSWIKKNYARELFILGLVVHLTMLCCAFLLPLEKIIPTIKTIALPLILIYSPATMLFGLLLVRQSNNFQNRLAKEKLHELERRLNQILKSGNIVSIVLDKSGIITFCNKYLLDITGYTHQDVVDNSWFNLFQSSDQINFFENILTNSSNPDSYIERFENTILAKNGKEIYIAWHFTRLLNEKNETVGITLIGVNVTEQKLYEQNLKEINEHIETQNEEYQQLNEELVQTNEELHYAKEHAEQSDRLKSSFLANMSHEIRTPMNGILGFADLLKNPNLSGDKMHKYIDLIEKSGERMLNIINDIIDISKIESGQMGISISKSDINEQVEYIYTFFKPEAEEKNLSLSYNTPLPNKLAIIKTDREKLYAILTNLVKNAIKYTDIGYIEFGYTITPIIQQDHPINLNKILVDPIEPSVLVFYVKDTGIGIPKDRMQAIFDRFVQADITDKRATQGAGLGLSITKAYVEMLGGRIWVESDEGKGSTFYLTIPYMNNLEENNVKNMLLESETNLPIRKVKILVAEDDETSRMLIEEAVETINTEVIFAQNGAEAVELFIANPDVDLILMDIQMPIMNGYEATKQIRSLNPKITIIAQTAYALSGEKEKIIEAGCNDYITKPFNRTVLMNVIKKYL